VALAVLLVAQAAMLSKLTLPVLSSTMVQSVLVAEAVALEDRVALAARVAKARHLAQHPAHGRDISLLSTNRNTVLIGINKVAGIGTGATTQVYLPLQPRQ
jgi:hypothetical protein